MTTRIVWDAARIGMLVLAAILTLSGCREETVPPTPVAGGSSPAQETDRQTAQQQGEASQSSAAGGQQEVQQAVVRLEPTEGNQARGEIIFTRTEEGIRVTAEVEGLSPGKHGFHVHEYGDCSAPDASSAGGHFNPEGTPHGAPENPPDQRHVGDLGNLEVGEDGTGRYEGVDTIIQLSGEYSIVGKAVVIHSGEDDYESQPAGDSGDRVACGIIEVAEK